MVTEESLKEKYSELAVIDLLEIVKNKANYTALAYSVALAELKFRKIDSQVINEYEPVLTNKINAATKQNCLTDLKLYHKLLYFYILWFPKARHFYSPKFMSGGYMLKDNQSNYYSICGFITLVVSIITMNVLNESSIMSFFSSWTAGFFLTYLFDVNYNRQRQIDNIQKILDKGEMPWGFY